MVDGNGEGDGRSFVEGRRTLYIKGGKLLWVGCSVGMDEVMFRQIDRWT